MISINKNINFIDFRDFKISLKPMQKSNIILFIDNNDQTKILKNRFGSETKTMFEDVDNLKRRLNRLNDQLNDLLIKHRGNELKYTYWGGYNLGYIQGKICEIEIVLDNLGVEID